MTARRRRALANFRLCLPKLDHWTVAFEPLHHAGIVRDLASIFRRRELIRLGLDPPARLAESERRHRDDEQSGFLELAVCDGDLLHKGIDYSAELMAYAGWPSHRVRLCFDVTDSTFDQLFAENPKQVQRRCAGLLRRLERQTQIRVEGAGSAAVIVEPNVSTWVAFTGLGPADYIVPAGEVACAPRAVDGSINIEGWVVGTIPFGPKYGMIEAGTAKLTVRAGRVTRVDGKGRALCRDLELVLDRVEGLRVVAELGFGQSRAVARAARRERVGCLWHERHLGVHFGLGATLAPGDRATPHHLDIVLKRGRATGCDASFLFEW
jgi:hypothetical protein